MYVIRPQFFIPMITLLRNVAKNSAQYKEQLAEIHNQNIDIANFENLFKDSFGKNATWAKAQDLSIKKLTKGNPTMIAKFAELEKES